MCRIDTHYREGRIEKDGNRIKNIGGDIILLFVNGIITIVPLEIGR